MRLRVLAVPVVAGLLRKFLDVEEGGTLLQGLGGEVVHVETAGGEAEVESLDVGTDGEVLFIVGPGALGGEVEGAEFAELDFLALQELFEDAGLELVGYAEADILAIDAVVLGHVLAQLLIGHGLRGDHTAVELSEAA